MNHLNEPSKWIVTLTDGGRVEVWADGYQQSDDVYVFASLVAIESEPSADALVTARTPTDPSRVEIAVARFPMTAVSEILSG